LNLIRGLKKRQGYSFVEVIIVVVFVSIMSAWTFSKLISIIEFARAREALDNMGFMRTYFERCYILRGESYKGCDSFNVVGVDNPEKFPQAHFTYQISSQHNSYMIIATRNTLDGGQEGDEIRFHFDGTRIIRSGTGKFKAVK